MQYRKRTPTYLAFLFCSLFLLQSAFAVSDCQHTKDKQPRHLATLNLSEEQASTIKMLRKETREKLHALKTKKITQQEVLALNPLSESYLADVKALGKTASKHRKQHILLMAKQRLAIYKVLTPEQQEKMREIETKPKHHKKHERKHGRKGKTCHHNKQGEEKSFKILKDKQPKKCHGYKLDDGHHH